MPLYSTQQHPCSPNSLQKCDNCFYCFRVGIKAYFTQSGVGRVQHAWNVICLKQIHPKSVSLSFSQSGHHSVSTFSPHLSRQDGREQRHRPGPAGNMHTGCLFTVFVYLYICISVCMSVFFFSGLPDATYPQQCWDPEQCVTEQWSPWQRGIGQADRPPEEPEQRLVPLPETDPGLDRGRIPGP